jgi:hypothetical protein
MWRLLIGPRVLVVAKKFKKAKITNFIPNPSINTLAPVELIPHTSSPLLGYPLLTNNYKAKLTQFTTAWLSIADQKNYISS